MRETVIYRDGLGDVYPVYAGKLQLLSRLLLSMLACAAGLFAWRGSQKAFSRACTKSFEPADVDKNGFLTIPWPGLRYVPCSWALTSTFE